MSAATAIASRPSVAWWKPRSRPKSNEIVFYGILGLLLFGPLAFGAVEAWSTFVLEAGATLLFLVWTLGQIRFPEIRVAWNPLFAPMLVFGALIVLQLATGNTAYRAATVSGFFLYIAYGLLCFLMVQSLHSTQRVRVLAAALTAYGLIIALFALFQSIASNGRIYWLRMPRSGGWIYGPYVNHNHYAGLMEMLVPIPLAIVFFEPVRGPKKAAAVVAAAVMASTIFLSGSRGGMLAFAVEMLPLAWIAVGRRKSEESKRTIVIFLAIAVVLLVWIGGAELSERVFSAQVAAKTELSGGTRLTIDRDALRMFTRKPALGWGLGTFAEVYPQFRSFPTNLLVDAAHNDYLQLLVEMGGLGLLVMLCFLGLVYTHAWQRLKSGPSDISHSVSLAALLGVTGLLVHSLLDFNLQIPANAAIFYLWCTLATIKPEDDARGERHRPSWRRTATT